MIDFWCPQCGKPVQVDEHLAGQAQPCPFYGAIRWLPTDDVRLEECRTAYDKGVVDPQDSWLVP